MIDDTKIRNIFDSPLLQRNYKECDHPTEIAALPDDSLDFLVALAQQLKISSVFEFGSGRSTLAFLKAGFQVTSLEDSNHWMELTKKQIPDADKGRHVSLVKPLHRRWHGGIPVMDWLIDSDLGNTIRKADLILVDSPYYTPFRESTLWSALIYSDHAIIVLDDTRIPTLSRFCDQIASDNPTLLHRRINVGHTFDIFARSTDNPLKISHTLVETLKGWRRFFLRIR